MKNDKWSWPIFEYLTQKAYHELEREGCGTLFTLQQVDMVFRYYFDQYQRRCRRQHPRLTYRNIMDLIYKLDDFEFEDYPALIDCYFDTRFDNCDYNVNHFFSGDIRKLRACECGLAGVYGLYEE